MDAIQKSFLKEPDSLTTDPGNVHIVVGGLVDLIALRDIRNSYQLAGDELVALALASGDLSYQYSYPIVFLYRHVIETSLKSVLLEKGVSFERSHNLVELAEKVVAIKSDAVSEDQIRFLVERAAEFEILDERSTRFRYGEEIGGEFLIHLGQLKEVVSAFVVLTSYI
ncbi:HEPN domain-containing protein [Owenweeksia hongkongensis DSM 17368]|uniref:HEPN domain-containing protein n=1 Tax=Owenweeksia hongkongensis (strain DSM 17368 / CIP 108786 / JCM 12287 / NRRL B-23963 / UST20020801) TaxID=926562 RepID=G8R5Q6_OWEHD|nr:HEPN domain-containing protein [Owenweeksia hongkongensis]AEV34372.1 HEPN domain-containing protein [Owenweeksia hongkongensis DSM 17368]